MSEESEATQFKPGNKFWEARSTHGAHPKYDANTLWDACVQYFDWVHENPLMSAESVKFQGQGKTMPVPKMRAMTLKGLCRYIGISFQTWTDWRSNRPDLSDIITRAEEIIYEQKFTGAAADLLNPNIIARELGLSDKKDHTSSDGSMSPPKGPDLSSLTDEQLAALESIYAVDPKPGEHP